MIDLLFTVIINCYNTLPIIRKCVESVIATTDENTEIILVNNHPPYPDVMAYLRGFNHPRVKVLDPGQNLSHIRGTEFAERYANGEYLVRMDDDAVVLHNNWINAMRDALILFPDLAYIGLPTNSFNLPSIDRHSKGNVVIEYVDMVMYTCVMFKRNLWKAHFNFKAQGIYGYDDGYAASKAKELGLKKAYLASHLCIHLGRSKDCDPLYGAWKLFYVVGKTAQDFAAWRETVAGLTDAEEKAMRDFGYPEDQIQEIKNIIRQKRP